jgi:hypothetical protein
MSTQEAKGRLELLEGTLNLLILGTRTLDRGMAELRQITGWRSSIP